MLIIVLNNDRHCLYSHLVKILLVLCSLSVAKAMAKYVEILETSMKCFLTTQHLRNPLSHFLGVLGRIRGNF